MVVRVYRDFASFTRVYRCSAPPELLTTALRWHICTKSYLIPMTAQRDDSQSRAGVPSQARIMERQGWYDKQMERRGSGCQFRSIGEIAFTL
jgi:hypothetical protein